MVSISLTVPQSPSAAKSLAALKNASRKAARIASTRMAPSPPQTICQIRLEVTAVVWPEINAAPMGFAAKAPPTRPIT